MVPPPPVDDILRGSWLVNAATGALAGAASVLMLMPVDTLKTNMQNGGLRFPVVFRGLWKEGGGARLYRGLGSAVSVVCVSRAMGFGLAAFYKRRLPSHWHDIQRDFASGTLSAVTKVGVVHPLDTIKTNKQIRGTGAFGPLALLRHPRRPDVIRARRGLYNGFGPAVLRSCIGFSMWVTSRNFLTRKAHSTGFKTALPRPLLDFVCGAGASIFSDLSTFAIDTVKKRLQAQSSPPSAWNEARKLLRIGGFVRFYRGYGPRVVIVAVNGATFNTGKLCARCVTTQGPRRVLLMRVPSLLPVQTAR